MDREGIDIAVLFATVVSSFCALDNVDFEVAMIRAYHRWLADYCAAYPNRLKGVAIVPMRAPERAAADRCDRQKFGACTGIAACFKASALTPGRSAAAASRTHRPLS